MIVSNIRVHTHNIQAANKHIKVADSEKGGFRAEAPPLDFWTLLDQYADEYYQALSLYGC